jgi:flagellin-specific chaperone FliS
MKKPNRIQEFLQRLTPPVRSNLLNELERLELAGAEIPGSAPVVEKLRAEFRSGGQSHTRLPNPQRFFFAPLEPLLVDGAPEHANSGRLQRGSLVALWEWISRDLLPTMARDYATQITDLIAADKQKEARQAANVFQTKVAKSLENTLRSPETADQVRAKLATYTMSRTAYDDLAKMLCILRARDALAKFDNALPADIDKFDDPRVAKMTQLLDGFGKEYAEDVPFALALVAKRLRTSWHLIYLATKAAPSKAAADVAATRYAVTISMVMDRLDDRRSALRIALKNSRILVAKELLIDIYDIENALRTRIDQFDNSEWGHRLDSLMKATADLVAVEVSRFPDNVGHILGSRSLRGQQSLVGRLSYWATEGAANLKKKIVSRPEKSRA